MPSPGAISSVSVLFGEKDEKRFQTPERDESIPLTAVTTTNTKSKAVEEMIKTEFRRNPLLELFLSRLRLKEMITTMPLVITVRMISTTSGATE